MSSADQRAYTSNGGGEDQDDDVQVRDIQPLTPPPWLPLPPPPIGAPQSDSWEAGNYRLLLSTLSNINDSISGENFTDDEVPEETNPLAIVPDISPLDHASSSHPRRIINGSSLANGGLTEDKSLQRVKREEIESKISAWQMAKIAKVNNRFKREDAIINGCESEQVQKAQSALKKVERKLEEKRARAIEKMRNKVAKAHGKAEEKRASAEAKRGTKVAKILEIANLMRAIGRAPTKRSFF